MTLPLPSKVGDPATQQCLDEIAKQFPVQSGNLANGVLRLVSDGNHKVAWGPVNVTFTASQLSATTTVTHGLGAKPSLVLAMDTSGDPRVVMGASEITETTFGISASYVIGIVTGTAVGNWLAIA